MPVPQFSVNVLLYGDYPALAERCLHSIRRTMRPDFVAEVRIGCNAISAATQRVLASLLHALPVPCHVYAEKNGANVGKYPLMRRMFHDAQRPLRGTHIMWFDDDSYITGSEAFWSDALSQLRSAAMASAIYTKALVGNQAAAIRAQPWYTGKPVATHRRVSFAMGGWWVARPQVIFTWDYPFPALHHNGGDVVLGELCRQQDYHVVKFNSGIAINADELGRESEAKRRGMQSKLLWQDWTPGCQEDYPHQAFDLTVESYG